MNEKVHGVMLGYVNGDPRVEIELQIHDLPFDKPGYQSSEPIAISPSAQQTLAVKKAKPSGVSDHNAASPVNTRHGRRASMLVLNGSLCLVSTEAQKTAGFDTPRLKFMIGPST